MSASDDIVKLLPELAAGLRGSARHEELLRRRPALSLTPRQMAAFVQLAGGPQTMTEFAHGMGVGRAAATELVERLAQKGLVLRERDHLDRRVLMVRLSDEAALDARVVVGDLRRRVERALAAVPEPSHGSVVAFLRQLVAALHTSRR